MRPPLASWKKLPLPTPSRHNYFPLLFQPTHTPCVSLHSPPRRSTPARSSTPAFFLPVSLAAAAGALLSPIRRPAQRPPSPALPYPWPVNAQANILCSSMAAGRRRHLQLHGRPAPFLRPLPPPAEQQLCALPSMAPSSLAYLAQGRSFHGRAPFQQGRPGPDGPSVRSLPCPSRSSARPLPWRLHLPACPLPFFLPWSSAPLLKSHWPTLSAHSLPSAASSMDCSQRRPDLRCAASVGPQQQPRHHLYVALLACSTYCSSSDAFRCAAPVGSGHSPSICAALASRRQKSLVSPSLVSHCFWISSA
jgi:hypothetical protein